MAERRERSDAEKELTPLQGRLAFLLTDPALPKEFREGRAPQKAEAVVRD